MKFPCGICEQGCCCRQRAICCDDYETWYHAKCMGMPKAIYIPLTKSHSSILAYQTCLQGCLMLSLQTENQIVIYRQSPLLSAATSHNPAAVAYHATSRTYPTSQDSDSFKLDEDHKQPLCSSLTKKTSPKYYNILPKHPKCYEYLQKPSFWNFNRDIVCGCETWLKPSICDSEGLSANSEYNIYRKDRPDGYGGSLLLIKNNIVSEPVDISTGCDIVFWKIECSNSQTLIVGSAYRPTNNDIDYTSQLIGTIRSVCHKFMDAVI